MGDAKRTVAEAYHPWEFIEEEMQARGWDRDELARRMGGKWDVNRLSLDLLEHACDTEMTDLTLDGGMGDLLGKAFGVSPRLFVNLYAYWRQWKLSQQADSRPIETPEPEPQ